MGYSKEFALRQAGRTDGLNRAVCVVGLVMEGGRLLAYTAAHRAEGTSLDMGYIHFYLAALAIVVCFLALDRLTRGHTWPHHATQVTGLTAALAWACLYARFEVRQGNPGTILPQIMLLTSAGARNPGPLHVGVNILLCLFYVLLLCFSGLPAQVLAREITDTAIYLLVSYAVIRATFHFQYDSYCTANKTLEARNAQLDMMSEQLEQLQDMEQKIVVARHDMRHYVWEVQQGLELGDLSIIQSTTARLAQEIDAAKASDTLKPYTGEAVYDAMLSRFAHWAEGEGVSFRAEMKLPKQMETQDLSLILMNALENAARAVLAQEAGTRRFIHVASNDVRGQYFFEMDNSFRPGSVELGGEDRLPRAKAPGHGYGTRSMASILERYGAVYRFQAEEDIFQFQFLLSDDK